ncbi:arginase family protein [Paraconexibacter algicola]|uniref:Arginase n=1 Tax=Paraconexibacter algicola TaxID=2133960 RepID=A0A2T4UFT5_9ACTN|nr:arginase family protein [Paraconexibacter algicola]PTL56620.1 arginase [Paraconexibacter algicola]
MSVRVVGLLCPTSDRRDFAGDDTAALASLLARTAGMADGPRLIGSAAQASPARFEDDLRERRGCLLEAGGQVEDALREGDRPVLVAASCSVCTTTIPAVLRERPDTVVLWLDAHGDFNTPDTTPSAYLGGMCLAAACGVWDDGLGAEPKLDPAQIVFHGVRDLDAAERDLLDGFAVEILEHPSQVLDAVRGRPVFVHLDLDVLDPELLPTEFPAAGGLTDGALKQLLRDVCREAELVGAEIASFAAPDRLALCAAAAGPLAEA